MAKIVLVDDDELICAIVTRTLAPHGHVVVSVRDGDDALDAIWEHAPALAILDCALPSKTGLTILREIRESAMFAALPVLILTARRSEWHVRMALDAGANDYVRKPFDAEELIGTIERMLAIAAPDAPDAAVVLDPARIADLRASVGVAQADLLLEIMANDITERTRTIATLLAASDRPGARRTAHALRCAADRIGAVELARRCYAIERESEITSAPIAASAAATVAAIAQIRTQVPLAAA